eukprot:scaffold29225_cov40-Attheya_sp.AAC.2
MTHHGTVDYGASIMVVVVVVHGTPSNAHSPFLPISRPFIGRSIQRYTIACLPACLWWSMPPSKAVGSGRSHRIASHRIASSTVHWC